MQKSIRLALAAAAMSWLSLAGGCAQNIGDIDLTQPDRVDVSTLNDGKPWWFLQTVTNVPPQSGFTFIGESSFPPDRVVWDVQQDWLVAYRNYEFIVGSQTPYSAVAGNAVLGNGTTASQTAYYGTPVAAYPISSHFDVERGYNPQTGEQTNVISENTTDRPWYERQYIRIDWSNNAFGGFNFLSTTGAAVGSLLTSPVSYFVDVEDPTNPDRAEITPSYIGITNKISYTGQIDQQLSAYYGQTIYTCWINQGAILGVTDCGPEEVTIKLSWEKIPDTHDFVPREFTDTDEIHFGVWQQQRLQYDQQRGIVEPLLAQNQYAVMHHIWTGDHRATPNNSGTGTCDVNDFTNTACIKPLNERTPKPIVYYVNPGWPDISDVRHYTMWVHEALISNDYDSDMRAVVAGALRGGPNSVENYMAKNGIPQPTGTAAIDYTQPASTYARYASAKGLDYLTYPPQINPTTLDSSGNLTDTTDSAYRGIRPDATWLDGSGKICNSSQIAQSIANPSSAICQMQTDCANHYCMGVGHVPYTVVPRMVVFCHNPVQLRKPTQAYNGQMIDKSDSTKPSSFDFSTPGDPDICDPRPDAERSATPLSPQMGDLRYHMHSYIPQPDSTSPGGIGEPAMDPVTGEIVSSHAYVYGRAVESYATLGADMVAVLNGWETYSDLLQGNIVSDYINSLETSPQAASLQPSKIKAMLDSPSAKNRVAILQRRVGASYNSDGTAAAVSGGVANIDYGVQAFTALQAGFNLLDPHDPEIARDFAPQYASQSSAAGAPPALPAAIQSQISMAAMLAPPAINTFNAPYEQTRRNFIERHALLDEEMEPTALRLAKYYQDKYSGANNPCASYGAFDGGAFPGGADNANFRTCIWEKVRGEILGNMWRSYSDHEVGHTFGQYHNFAGSTDALNYYDPYWDIRQENASTSVGSCAAADTVCNELTTELGKVPNNTALAPEWLQAPLVSSLTKGLREYQYTSIMDYNSKFNSDFQGLGKYDHATHMYQYGNMVEIFDPAVMPNVPPNTDATNHAHEVDNSVLQPFNAHYTVYPWILNDGVGKAKVTPLSLGIQKMIHARKWVRYDDLTTGTSTDLTAPLDDTTAQLRDGVSLSTLQSSIQVPYRFCSDVWNEGEAHCLWFDEGADAYEQANGFIKQYKYMYFFNNFKRQSVEFHLGDDYSSYYSRLWERNFRLQARIMQHYINDELILRYNVPCPEAADGRYHPSSIACGQDRTAAAVSIVDFATKLMQTPSTDTAGFDISNGVYCGAASCNQDSLTPDLSSGAALPPLTLQPGDSSKYDISQYNLNQYGLMFLYKPTVAGIWLDKILAAYTLSFYDTYFVGQLNNQPLSYLISANDIFFKDTQRAIGTMVTNDPRYWPLMSYNAAAPNSPATPPVTLYRNSDALARVANIGTIVNPWCPKDDPTCAQTGTPPQPKISSVYTATYDPPPAGYTIASYALPHTSNPIVTLPNNYIPMDPSPVYFEKLYALSLGAVYLTAAVDDQKFIDSIRVARKGDIGAILPAPLACNGDTTAVLGTTTAPSCQNGSACGPGAACGDRSACAIRAFHCAGDADTATSRTNGSLIGACFYGGAQAPNDNFSYANCDPDAYAEFTDTQSSFVYYATRYVPTGGDITDNNNGIGNYYSYYSPSYELLKQAESQAQSNVQGLGAAQFVDIMRSYYYWWNSSYPPGSPF